MKKQVQVLGLIAATIFLIGTVFKVQHYPGASILITLGAFAGVIYLFMYLLKGTNQLTSGLEKTTGIVGAVAMAIVLLGFMFKMMHWPAASILISVSQVGLLLTGILMLIDAFKETDPNKKSLKALTSFTIFILMVILFFVTILLNHSNT